MRASGDYHPTLGLQPAIGRLLTRDDDRPGRAAVVIGHAYWQRRFGGAALSVIGAGISVNRMPFTNRLSLRAQRFLGVNVGESSVRHRMSPCRCSRGASASTAGIWVDVYPLRPGSRSWGGGARDVAVFAGRAAVSNLNLP